LKNFNLALLFIFKVTVATDDISSIAYIKFWNPYQGGSSYEITTSPHIKKISSLKVIDNQTLASGSSDGYVKFWNYFTLSFIDHIYTGSRVRALELLNNGELACGLDNGVIQLWDLNTRLISNNLTSNNSYEVLALTLLANGNLVSGHKFGKIRIWKKYAQSLVFDFELDAGSDVRCLKLLPSLNYLASGLKNNVIKVWNLNGTNEYAYANLTGHTDDVNALELLDNGDLASGSNDDTIRVWNGATFEYKFNLTGHTKNVNTLKLLPDGNLASGSDDKFVIVWNLTTRQMTRSVSMSKDINALELLCISRANPAPIGNSTQQESILFFFFF
jgi:WD40 repeat protein